MTRLPRGAKLERFIGSSSRRKDFTTRTKTPRADEIEQKWLVADASGQVLGRLASRIAHVLRGKHKPNYVPHLDVGDFVVVVNAEKIRVTGKKADQKTYYRHTGYPGGLKARTYRELLRTRPERIIESAVRGMLPKTRLGRKMLKKLNVYAGPEHPHAAQQPSPLEFE